MNCPSCRQALHENARFCSNCGLSTASQHTGTDSISQQETLKYSRGPDLLIGRILDAKYELLERWVKAEWGLSIAPAACTLATRLP